MLSLPLPTTPEVAPPAAHRQRAPPKQSRVSPANRAANTGTPTGGGRCRGASARSCRVTISCIPASRSMGSGPASSQPRPVRPRQTRMSTRPLALGHRELMAQHQDLGVLPPRLPARQAQQRHGPGNNQEDQLQAHKPKIIARPARPGPGSHAPDTGPSHRRPEDASDQVAQDFGTHNSGPWTGVSVHEGPSWPVTRRDLRDRVRAARQPQCLRRVCCPVGEEGVRRRLWDVPAPDDHLVAGPHCAGEGTAMQR
jgi:hypothetical protein